jgi:hypothetical protein
MERADEANTLRQRLGPAPTGSGFRMDGWFVWCGSAIEVDGEYHLFAARWPVASGFPDGYRDHSEIVRATAREALGPYTFQEVVVAKRGGDWWDGGMAHHPAIYRRGGPGGAGQFLLYYIGSRAGSHYREIGLATAERITGPWRRPDRPLDLGVQCDANNPAALFEPDGSVKLVWRTQMLRVRISTAPHFAGPSTGEPATAARSAASRGGCTATRSGSTIRQPAASGSLASWPSATPAMGSSTSASPATPPGATSSCVTSPPSTA